MSAVWSVTISTFQGISYGAIHYYAKLWTPDHEAIEVERSMTAREALKRNRAEGVSVYRPGDPVRGFPTRAAAMKRAIEEFGTRAGYRKYPLLTRIYPILYSLPR